MEFPPATAHSRRPPKAAAHFERIKYADLTEQTYEAIRGRILRRELTTGEQIPIDRVAAELGVSRTPVLDAIKRLAVEGLIGIRPRRGCFVLGLSVVDIREIFGLREALETYAADFVIVEGRYRELADELEALSRQMAAFTEGDLYTDYDAFIERDRAFHMALVRSAGNSRMTESYQRLNVHLHIMRAHYVRVIRRATDVHSDHAAILSAIRAGDASAARAAASAHLTIVRDRMLAEIEREGGRM
jgi:GntR family transcriptional regulator, rspAB operon transcriptional repressor